MRVLLRCGAVAIILLHCATACTGKSSRDVEDPDVARVAGPFSLKSAESVRAGDIATFVAESGWSFRTPTVFLFAGNNSSSQDWTLITELYGRPPTALAGEVRGTEPLSVRRTELEMRLPEDIHGDYEACTVLEKLGALDSVGDPIVDEHCILVAFSR